MYIQYEWDTMRAMNTDEECKCALRSYDTLIALWAALRALEMPSIFSRMITERYSLVSAHTLAALRFVRSTSARRPVGPSFYPSR